MAERRGTGSTRPAPLGGGSPRRRLILTTAGVSVVLTFLATQAGGWLFGRLADGLATAATPVISVDSSGPLAEPWNVVVPQHPDALTGSSVQAEALTRWAINKGGGPASEVQVELTIWGNRDRPVLIEGLRAIEVDCVAAPAWTEITASVGGAVPERRTIIDLDSGSFTAEPDPAGEPFRFPLQVSQSELEHFTVRAKTRVSSCTFKLAVVVRDAGREKLVVVDDDGGAFRVVSPAASTAHMEWHATEDGLWTPTRG